MTEEEALQKWCPMIRAAPRGEYGTREVPASQSCIGSDCMWWRWNREPTPPDFTFAGKKDGEPGDGYCGAAGIDKSLNM